MKIDESVFIRHLQSGQVCTVNIGYADGRPSVEIFRTDELLLEAPNWSPNGQSLCLNGGGRLWRLEASGGELTEVDRGGIPTINNDHVLAPHGQSIFVTANDGHIYELALEGPAIPRRVTDDNLELAETFFHFLHGVSPDGTELAYAGYGFDGELDFSKPLKHQDIFTVPAAGGPTVRLTHFGQADGPEYSPDGKYIYINTEGFAGLGTNSQIGRIERATNRTEQLTFDNRVNWFPHISPDGNTAVYLSFPPGTIGHPADLEVALKVVPVDDWQNPTHEIWLFGGQGTINVNSWSPGSDAFAFVAYPFV